MPDGRFLSKSIAHDLELNTVSLAADYLFSRCIPHLDVEGRMPGHPSQVKGMACPMRDELTVEVVDAALGELAAAELVRWYMAEGRPCLEFPGFTDSQRGLRKDREAASRIPPPTEAVIRSVVHASARSIPTAQAPQTPAQEEDGHPDPPSTGATPDLLRSDSGEAPAKGSQVKPSEGRASSSLCSEDGRGPIVENSRSRDGPAETVTAGNTPDDADARAKRYVLKLIREELHRGVNDDECRRSADILLSDFWGRVSVEDLADGIRGIRLLVDAGQVSGVDPGRPFGLRFARSWKGPSGRLLWDEAVDYVRYHREAEAKRRGGALKRVSVG